MKKNCMVCGSNNLLDLNLIIKQGGRGNVKWAKCCSCKSFMSLSEYSKEEESIHTSTNTSWGKEDTGKQLNHYKYRLFKEIGNLLFKYSPPPANLFDIGCSYGGFLFEMKKKGYSVAGYDIVPAAIKYLREKGLKAEISFNVDESHLLKEKKFNIITAIDSNCYWNDQIKNLKNIYNLLSPNGVLALRVVDKSNYIRLGIYLKKINSGLGNKLILYSVNDHLTSIPIKSLLNILVNIGFKIKYVSSNKAIHSFQTNWFTKLLFYVGEIFRQCFGINFAPGVVVIAKK